MVTVAWYFGAAAGALPLLTATPAMKERLAAQGAIPSGNTPQQFAQLIDRELKKWQPVVKASGAKVD